MSQVLSTQPCFISPIALLPACSFLCLSACPSAFTLPAFPHFRLPSPKLPTVDLSVQAKVKPPLVWHGDLPGASADREWRREPSSTNANASFRQNRILRPSRTHDARLTQWFPGTGLARPTASPHRLSSSTPFEIPSATAHPTDTVAELGCRADKTPPSSSALTPTHPATNWRVQIRDTGKHRSQRNEQNSDTSCESSSSSNERYRHVRDLET